jgi:hypothetical protein
VSYNDETLMAYADGELDELRRAEIAAAIEKDPELARRIEQHRALRAEVAGAFAGLVNQPVPERLRAAALAPRASDAAHGNVVRFPARGTPPRPAPWGGREWTAMAASLVLGVMLTWRFLAPDGGDIATQDGVLMARGDLAEVLNMQLASSQSDDAAVLIGLTFKASDGGYCRSFVARANSMAGLACRSGEDWRIGMIQSVNVPGGDLRQAASSMPPAILQAIESGSAGEPLDAAAERVARDAGWVTGAPGQ